MAATIVIWLPAIMLAIALLVSNLADCRLAEGSAYPCFILRLDFGSLLYAFAVSGWLMLVTLPFMALTVLIWLARAVPRGRLGQVSRQARMMTATRHAIFLAAALAIVLPVRADTRPECHIAGRIPHDDLPASVATEIRARFGPLSWPSGLFNATDIVQPGIATRRLIDVWRKGDRWVVAIEQGGRGYHLSVVALDFESDRNRVRQLEKRTAFPGNLCATVADLLASRAS